MKVESVERTETTEGAAYYDRTVTIQCGSFKMIITLSDAAWAGQLFQALRRWIEVWT